MFTGNITYCAFKPAAINVPTNGTQIIQFMVSDINLNAPVPGTKITAAVSSAGQLFGNTSYTVPDGIGGPFEVSFIIGESVPGAGGPAQLTITVTAGNNEVLTCPQTVVFGTIN